MIYAESSVLSLPGEAIIKLESVMGRETMGPVRDGEEKPCKLNFKMTMRLGDLTFYGQ